MLIRRVINPVDEPANRRRKVWKRFFWGVVIIIIGIAGWVGVTGALALKNITAKNTDETPSFFKFGSNIDPDKVLAEGESRINILLLGVDSAAGLTDSIQIASIDPINNSIAMLSIPRDLYVTNPAKNRKTRINEVYRDSSKNCPRKTSTCDPEIDYGAESLSELIEDLVGVKTSYFVKIDFDGLKRIVDTVGGIQVYVEKPLSDPNFPNRSYSGYDPFSIGAGMKTLNGETALKYARCRGGNCGGDFGRARRQQQVVIALRDKIVSSNLFINPQKITSIITAVGKGLRTDLTVDQISQLYKLIKDTKSDRIKSAVLENGNDGVLRSTTIGGAYVLVPKKGDNDWTEVIEFVNSYLPEPYLVKENASVVIIDASGKTGTGQAVATKLKSLGYNVTSTQVASSVSLTTTIKYFEDAPYATALLKKRFGINPTKGKADERPGQAKVVITVGSNYKAK
ncbi:MAG: LCP family protein [Candidatus Berkelbacteria bacterium]|nr:MAG: LCP family protein [Candidatus Berkelbacteria bacterium]QQG51988.1 MAG: LCP family protein [Candidatus Berkelbacteria bacterium]